MKQVKQNYFRTLGITMVIYAIGVFVYVWLSNGPLAHVNLRPVSIILPFLPMISIFPAMIRFLNHPQ